MNTSRSLFSTFFPAVLWIFLGSFFIVSCTTTTNSTSQTQTKSVRDISWKNVPNQKNAPTGFHSLQLTNSEGGAPISSLNAKNSLVLRFDEIGNEIHNFIVRARHFDNGWKPSVLLNINYMESMSEDVIFEGKLSRSDRPAYVSYSYSFPNRNFAFTVSGSYLLDVIDQRSGETVFTLPFWIGENLGAGTLYFEEFQNTETYPRILQQLFFDYEYPSEVKVPQVDLKTEFYQNQLWGRPKTDLVVDNSRSGHIRWHTDRNNAFPGIFEIKSLDISRIERSDQDVFSFDMAPMIPKVMLRRDIMFLEQSNSLWRSNLSGSPSSNTDARYSEVTFRLEPGQNAPISQNIFLVGSFTNWEIAANQRLNYNPTENLYYVNAILKEGLHSYKYVEYDGNKVDALAYDDAYSNSGIEYHVFVYYRDISKNYMRLLNVFQVMNRPS